jgi:oligopeptide/dipeptide ABC transporter ATP-binding protein
MTALTTPAALAAPAPVADDRNILEVSDLTVTFPTQRGIIRPVHGATFSVTRGQTLGIVGESGSGKSVTLRALLGLVPSPGRVESGHIRFDGRELVGASASDLRAMRGRDIGMIFQDPMSSLNPVLTVGDQLTEVIRVKLGLGRKAATDRAVELFERVGIHPARSRLRSYPHQFSGGMAQRVMIAIAVATRPRLLLADEPTTALDVSVQDQVLDLLEDLRQEEGMSMIIVSHDIGVVARTCDAVAVMYAGSLLERGTVEQVLRRPRHPYTRMLLATVPSLRPNVDGARLVAIGGQLPDLATLFTGCPFAPRCGLALPSCSTLELALDQPADAHASSCPVV